MLKWQMESVPVISIVRKCTLVPEHLREQFGEVFSEFMINST